jgi:CSLREA domain-containing protein
MFRSIRVATLAFCVLALAQVGYATTYTVSKIADTNDGMCDADCSLREAVTAANATVDNDIILFALPLFASPQAITLSGTEIVIANNGSLTIYGTGANRLTVSGNNASRIISISDNGVANIHHIRFTGGTGAGAVNTGRGGAIYNNGGTALISHCVFTGNTGANGGAMNNATAGTLTIANSVMANNTATSVGGALQNFSTSTMHIINTSITGNSCGTSSTGGGAMQGNGAITMTNVTMSGNSSLASGGGLYYNGTGLTLTNTTITGNTSASNAGGLHKSTVTNNANIRNSIISGNTGGASPDVTNVFNSLGNNIIGTVGTSTGWVGSDLQNTNPLITPLGFYGGLGMTHALVGPSPALNAGQNCVVDLSCAASNPPVAVTTDQRGAVRPTAAVDIGAFESAIDYYAVFPSAVTGVAYNFTLAPATSGFTYLLNSGSFGGITVSSSTSATLSGTANGPGLFGGLVQITNGPSAFVNYLMYVVDDPLFVPVGGRLFASDGTPARKASISLTDRAGIPRTTITNGLGYYTFSKVPVGETYTMTVSSKQYQFAAQTVTVNDALSGLNFTAMP